MWSAEDLTKQSEATSGGWLVLPITIWVTGRGCHTLMLRVFQITSLAEYLRARQNPHYHTLRLQVANNHILTQNLYYNYYDPKPKYLIIGYLDPLG